MLWRDMATFNPNAIGVGGDADVIAVTFGTHAVGVAVKHRPLRLLELLT
ncbi:MAG: hypothetical protein ACKV2Q_21910 [Planctomycetaceae bacterium]